MNKILIIILLLAVIFTSLFGCQSERINDDKDEVENIVNTDNNKQHNTGGDRSKDLESWFGLPEKIVIYYEGEKETISKNDEAYEQIINLLNERILSSKDPGTVDYDYDIYEVEKIRQDGIALDLIYHKVMKANIVSGEDLIEREYNRLFIPVTGNDSKLLFFGNPNISGGVLGIFYENETLIDYVIQLEKFKY